MEASLGVVPDGGHEGVNAWRRCTASMGRWMVVGGASHQRKACGGGRCSGGEGLMLRWVAVARPRRRCRGRRSAAASRATLQPEWGESGVRR
uniref:Uncharacterized protein n=1 Tax=Aegilops tauschii TaxID=37682 RepID=M8CU08_AEGTA